MTFKCKIVNDIVVNTSFNVRGEPILFKPEDTCKCFMRIETDYFVVNNFILKKTEQPN